MTAVLQIHCTSAPLPFHGHRDEAQHSKQRTGHCAISILPCMYASMLHAHDLLACRRYCAFECRYCAWQRAAQPPTVRFMRDSASWAVGTTLLCLQRVPLCILLLQGMPACGMVPRTLEHVRGANHEIALVQYHTGLHDH